jgi:hypothetical protein
MTGRSWLDLWASALPKTDTSRQVKRTLKKNLYIPTSADYDHSFDSADDDIIQGASSIDARLAEHGVQDTEAGLSVNNAIERTPLS